MNYVLSRPEYWFLAALWAALFFCMICEYRGDKRKRKALALRYSRKLERLMQENRTLKGRLESKKSQHNTYLEQQLAEKEAENATLRAQLKIKDAIIKSLEAKPA